MFFSDLPLCVVENEAQIFVINSIAKKKQHFNQKSY